MSRETKLRLVVLTVSPLTVANQIFIERLRTDDDIELSGIVVDSYRMSKWKRASFLMRHWKAPLFLGSIMYKFIEVAIAKCSQIALSLFNRISGLNAEKKDFEYFQNKNIPIIHVENVNSETSAKKIAELKPDLCAILGGRIIKPHILVIPKNGTINIHRHNAQKYRGGAQVGYIERLTNEFCQGVTIHYATPELDAGDIILYDEFPIECCDTDKSIEIKAEYFGLNLYYKAIKAIAKGQSKRLPQDPGSGTTYITTPYLTRYLFWRKYKKRLYRSLIPKDESFAKYVVRQFARNIRFSLLVLLLPIIARKRRLLESAGKAPIIIFYYHGIGNSCENWRTLPLEFFHAQIEYLNKYFKIISLDDAVQRLRSGNNNQTAAVLTFDDGYESIYLNLFPYLKFYGIPATVFACAQASLHERHLMDFQINGGGNVRIMDAGQLRDLCDNGIEIGSHGNFHENMMALSGEKLKHAIHNSAATLMKILDRKIKYFSFPFGTKKHISSESMILAKKTYDAVFSAYGGYNLPMHEPTFHFQRFSNPVSIRDLICIMHGFHRLSIYKSDRPNELS